MNISPMRHGLAAAIASELRAEKGRQRLSQRALADLIGRDQSYVSKRLSGQASLTLDEYVTLCQALDVRPDEMLRRALDQLPAVRPSGQPAAIYPIAADEHPSYTREDVDADYEQA